MMSEEEQARIKSRARKFALTISASDYAIGVGKDLTSYEFECITGGSLVDLVIKGERVGAEIIVDIKPAYEVSRVFSDLYLIGTGLIPKDK